MHIMAYLKLIDTLRYAYASWTGHVDNKIEN